MNLRVSASAWVYIMTNKPNGVIYVGATGDLDGRIRDHRRSRGSAFTAKFNCDKFVYCEAFSDIRAARERELQIKVWKRQWKIDLIESVNPQWLDLPIVTISDPKRSV